MQPFKLEVRMKAGGIQVELNKPTNQILKLGVQVLTDRTDYFLWHP